MNSALHEPLYQLCVEKKGGIILKYTLIDVLRYKSGKIKYYVLRDLDTCKVSFMTATQIKKLINESEFLYIENLDYNNGRLIPFPKGFDCIAVEYTGSLLMDVINEYRAFEYNQHPYVEKVLEYCNGTVSDRLVAVCGIRGSGKTSVLWHTISELLSQGVPLDDIRYIKVNSSTDIDFLISSLRGITDSDDSEHTRKYLFIDDITDVDNFISCSAWLSHICMHDVKVVISGENDLVTDKAMDDYLFDRVFLYNLNSMSFSDYCNMFGIKGTFDLKSKHDKVFEFIHTGGNLSNITIKDNSEAIGVIDSYVVQNILDTLRKNDDFVLRELKKLNCVQIKFLVYVSLAGLLSIKFDDSLRVKLLNLLFDDVDKADSLISEIDIRLMWTLGFTLIKLGVITDIHNYMEFSDVRKYFTDNLKLYESISLLFNYVNTEDTLKNLVLSQCSKAIKKIAAPLRKEYYVGHVKDENMEIDVVIRCIKYSFLSGRNTSNRLIQVRDTYDIDEKDWGIFKEECIIKKFGNNVKKFVLYWGKTKDIHYEIDGKSKVVHYVNLYDFLLDTESWII